MKYAHTPPELSSPGPAKPEAGMPQLIKAEHQPKVAATANNRSPGDDEDDDGFDSEEEREKRLKELQEQVAATHCLSSLRSQLKTCFLQLVYLLFQNIY